MPGECGFNSSSVFRYPQSEFIFGLMGATILIDRCRHISEPTAAVLSHVMDSREKNNTLQNSVSAHTLHTSPGNSTIPTETWANNMDAFDIIECFLLMSTRYLIPCDAHSVSTLYYASYQFSSIFLSTFQYSYSPVRNP